MRIILSVVLGLVLSSLVSGQVPRVIDISVTAPSDFPSDGTPLMVGDHSQTPHFFWIQQNRLSAYRVDEDGRFSALTFAGVPSQLSALKMAPRSYWANALFFWGLQGNSLGLWAIRDSGSGFQLSRLLTLVVPTGTSLPSFWVEPYGRKGWIVFYLREGGLQALFWGFDGATQNLGNIAVPNGTLTDVKLFERPDLDSEQADIVLFSRDGGFDRFETIFLSGFRLSAKKPLVTFPINSTKGWSVVYQGSEASRTFVAASGNALSGVPIDQTQIKPTWSQDFGIPVHLALRSAPQVMGAVAAVEDSGSRFWWKPVANIGPGGFVPGVVPYEGSPVPLVTDGTGNWGYLSGTTTAKNWTLLSAVGTSRSSSLPVFSGDLLWGVDPDMRQVSVLQWSGGQPTAGFFASAIETSSFPVLSAADLAAFSSELSDLIGKVSFPPPGTSGWFWGKYGLESLGPKTILASRSWGSGPWVIVQSKVAP